MPFQSRPVTWAGRSRCATWRNSSSLRSRHNYSREQTRGLPVSPSDSSNVGASLSQIRPISRLSVPPRLGCLQERELVLRRVPVEYCVTMRKSAELIDDRFV